jgi:cytosine/adenosine deaminase-related metal-dependent hydrolase
MTGERTALIGGLVFDPVEPDLAACETRTVVVSDGRIEAILQPDVPVPGDAITVDARGLLITPGFVNAHTHSPLAPLRGTADRLDHVGFMWRNQADTTGRSADDIAAVTRLAAATHLLAGTTTVIDHFPEQLPTLDAVAAAVGAYRDIGLRAVIALRVFDRPYDDIETPAARAILAAVGNPLEPRPAADILSFLEEAIEAFHDPGAGIAIWPGPSNPLRCSDDLLVGCADIAARHDTGLHAHLLETAVQRTLSLERTGVGGVAHLAALGILDARWSFAHAVWVDDADIDLLGHSRAVAVHNPQSNSKLGVGVMPLVAMRQAGVAIALGTDGASTNDTQSMQEAAALAAMLPRIRGEPREQWPDASNLFGAATAVGGRAVSTAWPTGRLLPGYAADLTLRSLTCPELSPLNDAAQQLVFADRGGSLRHVMVGGRWVMRDGALTGADLQELLRDAVMAIERQDAGLAALRALSSSGSG